ncbi:hypothetical protein FOT62_24770 [Serratia marcescens]|uniref:Virulence factor membrane-bound polymerase C-terminal domain-containing protein n=1 Tax=Serratia marcescens TaxID=615 RepID=A0A5C7BL91_SERMA|nr:MULTISPECIES: O-antigen ligase family protein [Serratia]TXE24480.1 hypothetical protein FOT62_24770 [Serratia marcescens]TXE53316.1 hypothetical protein FOT56_27205 [Serratia marcescens]
MTTRLHLRAVLQSLRVPAVPVLAALAVALGVLFPPLARTAWALLGGLLALAVLLPAGASRSALPGGRTWRWAVSAGLLLTALPLLWMPAWADRIGAVQHVAGVLLMVAGIGALSVRRLSPGAAGLTGALLVLAGLVAVAVVFRQVYWPGPADGWMPPQRDGRPGGTFFQVNVMASFLATALGVAVHLWLTRRCRLLLPAIALLAWALVLCQSTVGALGVLGTTVMLCLAARRAGARAALSVAGSLTAGLAAPCLVLMLAQAGSGSLVAPVPAVAAPARVSAPAAVHPAAAPAIVTVDHLSGWVARLQMARGALRLGGDHPLTGQGYGTFVGLYPDALARLQEVQQEAVVVTHPHNELLYRFAEGGLVAVAGLTLLLGAGLWLTAVAWRGGRGHHPRHDAAGWLLCCLPILLHTQTEYPLYQSGLHALLLVLLAGVGLARLRRRRAAGPAAPAVTARVCRGLLLAGGLIAAAWGVTAARVTQGAALAGQTLGVVIQPMMQAAQVNPWANRDGVGYGHMLNQLQWYQRDADPARLADVAAFLDDWLRRHPDPSGYRMLLGVLRLQGDADRYRAVLAEARRRVPWDPHFAPLPLSSTHKDMP